MKYLFFFGILITSIAGYAKEYRYHFVWMKIPVSELKIDINYDTEFSKNIQNVEFFTKLIGPLSVMREYSSTVNIIYQDYDWDYHLKGIDRGKPEEKIIHYSKDGKPLVNKFIDDLGVIPILPKDNLDEGSVDPFTVMIRTIIKLSNTQDCNDSYKVFDAKRRYNVSVTNYNDKNIGDKDIATCKLSITSGKTHSKEDYLSRNNRWPFNKEERSMNISFSKKLGYMPVKFKFNTPLGVVVGKLLSE